MGVDIKKIIQMGTGIAQPFVPGAAGKILDIVNKTVAGSNDPASAATLKELAKHIEDLVVVAQNQEQRIRALEAHCGL